VYRRRYESRRSSKPKLLFKTKKYGEKRFLICRMEFLHLGTITTLISSGDYTLQCGMWLWNRDSEFTKWQTLQCDTWLWDDMPFNLPKRPPYWNSIIWFPFPHIIAVGMSFCISLRNVIQIGPPSAEKNDVMSIFKMADLSHLGL